MKVSVITPFYNALPFLRQSAESVLSQSLREIELILVDDGSNDGSGELADTLAKEDARVRVLHQPNRGVSAARNAGLAAASGEYIGFVDADDYVSAPMYEALYTLAKEHSADIVTAGLTAVDAAGSTDHTEPPPFPAGAALDRDGILALVPAMHQSGCFQYIWRSIFSNRLIRDHTIRFDEGIAIGEDTLFCMHCYLAAARAVSSENTGYHYRLNPAGAMKAKYKPLLQRSLEKQYEVKKALCERYAPSRLEAWRADCARYNLTALLPLLTGNLYRNRTKGTYAALKKIARSSMIAEPLKDFDLSALRSKSLDYYALLCLQRSLFLPAHALYRFAVYRGGGS